MTQTPRSGRHRRVRHFYAGRAALMSALGVAAVTGWTLGSADSAPSDSAPQARTAAAEAPIEIQRTGQVVTVSEDALTTVSPEGHTTTFRLPPDTNRVTGGFEPSQNVVVVGVVRNGVPVATAVAERGAVGPDGPPMDYGLPT